LVRAAGLRIVPEVSVEEYLDLLAYVFDQRPGTGAILLGEDFVIIVAEEEGELRAYVIPPDARDRAITRLTQHPALKAKIEDLGVTEIDPTNYDPLAPYLPTEIRPLPGEAHAEQIQPTEGEAQAEQIQPTEGEAQAEQIQPTKGEAKTERIKPLPGEAHATRR